MYMLQFIGMLYGETKVIIISDAPVLSCNIFQKKQQFQEIIRSEKTLSET